MWRPPKNRYEHIHVRLAVAILGHRHFWEGATPLFFKLFSNRSLLNRLAERLGAECLPITPISEAWRVWAFDRMSAAKDGRRQAHMDVLVAVLAKAHTRRATPQTRRLGTQARSPARAKGLNQNDKPWQQGKSPHQSHEHGKPRKQPEVDGRDEVG